MLISNGNGLKQDFQCLNLVFSDLLAQSLLEHVANSILIHPNTLHVQLHVAANPTFAFLHFFQKHIITK